MNIFNIAGSGMSAQLVRLNTIASNLSNANTMASSEAEAYRGKMPVFATGMPTVDGFGEVMDRLLTDESSAGVRVLGVVESDRPVEKQYNPHHPLANEQGFVFLPTVNALEEMANMMSASRAYQTNTQIMDTSKDLMMKTIRLGK